jgi:hypothetical protein
VGKRCVNPESLFGKRLSRLARRAAMMILVAITNLLGVDQLAQMPKLRILTDLG